MSFIKLIVVVFSWPAVFAFACGSQTADLISVYLQAYSFML